MRMKRESRIQIAVFGRAHANEWERSGNPASFAKATAAKEFRIVGRAGFSLLELIVVIGVIAILVGILFPAVSSARAKAREREATATMRALENAIMVYHADNGKWPINDDNFQNTGGTLLLSQHQAFITELVKPNSGGVPYWETPGCVTNWSKKPPVPFTIIISVTNNTVTVQ
jgi:prepilin-type N-terminal cleavage/methylation domain-containing protein